MKASKRGKKGISPRLFSRADRANQISGLQPLLISTAPRNMADSAFFRKLFSRADEGQWKAWAFSVCVRTTPHRECSDSGPTARAILAQANGLGTGTSTIAGLKARPICHSADIRASSHADT